MSSVLPPASPSQPYVTVSPFAAGTITLPDHFFISPSTPGASRSVPSLSFLVTHPGTSHYNSHPDQPFHLMFDLGLRKSATRYPPPLQHHLNTRAPFTLAPGAAAQLTDGGVEPASIDVVVLSHVHYDHHGDPEDFPNAHFLVGPGALAVLQHGLGNVASHQHFDPHTLPPDRSAELPSLSTSESWKPLGPFPCALDLLSDGSIYVIHTPGHLPGHINLLCRMVGERWVLLCGDAYHDRRLLTGEKEIGTWEGPDGREICIHLDRVAAEESLRRLREFQGMVGGQVELVAAHEEDWWEEARRTGRAFPGKL